jgi:glycosyltransferase involved in cell wall biosynthesis
MRIVQIIDSLDAGGGERMAVNYANALAHEIPFSGLVATRKLGPLLPQLEKGVSFLFLEKKKVFDLSALLKLRVFILKNKVTHIHAHGSSFFVAFLLKLIQPSVTLIWHNHYGKSEFSSQKRLLSLKLTAPFFSGVIAVNQKLKVWSEQIIKSKNVVYLPNFAAVEKEASDETFLNGIDGKRIVVLANLRAPKNHLLLLEVAKKLKERYPEWSFHLVGKDYDDDYSNKIKKVIRAFSLEKTVFIYGSKSDVKNILNQAEIGVLTSKSEGLPVALLEYGLYNMPVVVTDVGEIPFVIAHRVNGMVVPSADAALFHHALVECIENEAFRKGLGQGLHETVLDQFSEKAVIKYYLNWLQTM